MTGTIHIKPEIAWDAATTVVGFTASTDDGELLRVRYTIEDAFEPSALAATEAMLISAIALAMQRGRVLRVHGAVSRSLRHTIDLYQDACAWWWPERYRKVPVEVDVVDDRLPATTRGVLCFSGGLDSVYCARHLGAARQIDTGLLVQGYDVDAAEDDERHQRERVARLLDRLGLAMTVIRSNARQALGQAVIEGAQGSYLAAASTLLSDRFGRGFVSSGIVDLADIAASDPVHEATIPLLGSTRYPILVYGGQVARIDKLVELAAMPELFEDVRVCLGRTEAHCMRCPKCLLNAFACVAATGSWPHWYPEGAFDVRHIAAMPLTETRRRYGQEILRRAAAHGRHGQWRTALAAHLGAEPQRAAGTDAADRPPVRRPFWRRRLQRG